MPRVAFEQLPERSRLWIFAAERVLNDTESTRLLREVDEFIDQWVAHKVPLTAARDWRYGQFLFVGVDEEAAGLSGCSIDSLLRRMKLLQSSMGVELVNNTPVVFRNGETIERLSRERFAELANTGVVNLETPVFDNTLTRVRDLRAGRWETKAANAWHAQVFFDS